MGRENPTGAHTPRELQQEFLDRIEDPERRASAIELFTDDAVVTRPGGYFEGWEEIEEYLSSGADRYQEVRKDIERWIETDEYSISIGTLHGITRDGTPFEGVRYVDICRVQNGSINRLDVYNDSHVAGLL